VESINEIPVQPPRNIVLLNIPPYYPELNTAEKVWQLMKKIWQ